MRPAFSLHFALTAHWAGMCKLRYASSIRESRRSSRQPSSDENKPARLQRIAFDTTSIISHACLIIPTRQKVRYLQDIFAVTFTFSWFQDALLRALHYCLAFRCSVNTIKSNTLDDADIDKSVSFAWQWSTARLSGSRPPTDTDFITIDFDAHSDISGLFASDDCNATSIFCVSWQAG